MLLRGPLAITISASSWLLATAQTTSSSSLPTATIENGTIVGTTTSLPAATAPVNKFLGIPFAQSPPERFSPAQSAGAFNGTLTAQSFSPACIQQFTYPEATANFTKALFNTPPPPGESEDCLYLNIYAPSDPAPADGRAVLFWIFGGGLQFGTGSLAAYDGSAFAAYNDVILVTHNYRTNVFGFPGFSQLNPQERNLGFLDQRLAMQWVQENIAAFGGDPSKVTIFGESAGGFSVDSHLTSFTTDTAPFRAAIMESGQISYQPSNMLGSDNDASFQQLASLANCTSTDILTCLRSVPATTVKSIIEQNSVSFPPVQDNYTLYANRAARRAAGQFAQVPIMIGTNADEGRLFALGETNLTAYIQTTIGTTNATLAQQILQAFPVGGNTSDYDQIARIMTLLTFQCGSAYLASLTAAQGIPAWRYFFNASFPNYSPLNGLLRAFHSAEIPLVFQTYAGGPVNPVSTDRSTLLPIYLPSTAEQYALGHYMNAAWALFAQNPSYGPGWGKVSGYYPEDIAVLGGSTGLDAGAEMANGSVVDAQCEIFRSLFEAGSGVSLPGLSS